MFWGGFGKNGVTPLVEVERRMDSKGYQNILKDNLLPIAPQLAGRGWAYQQDNASIHVSASTTQFFASKRVRVLPWPAKSPDLNPVENLWGILTHKVYAHGKQYGNVRDLKAAILNAWYNIPSETLLNLLHSMKNRIFKVILGHGKFTK